MDGYLERDLIPERDRVRRRGGHRLATRQVREPESPYQIALEPEMPPVLDFVTDAEIVRTVVQGEWLT